MEQIPFKTAQNTLDYNNQDSCSTDKYIQTSHFGSWSCLAVFCIFHEDPAPGIRQLQSSHHCQIREFLKCVEESGKQNP